MDEEFQKYEQIEAYLSNKMPEQERIVFDKKIQADSEFAQEVELHALANDFVIEQRLFSFEEKIKALRPIKTNFFSIKNTLIGLTFISLGLSLFLIFSQKKEIKQQHQQNQIIQVAKKESVISQKTEKQYSEVVYQKDAIISQVKIKKTQIITEKTPQIQKEFIDTTIINKEVKEPQIVLSKKYSEDIALKKSEKSEIIIVKKKNLCEENQVIFTLESTDACENVADAKVMVKTIEGGKKPYVYSINQKDYYSFNEFGGLLQGKYTFTVKDSDNCIYPKEITVKSKDCKQDQEYLLNPQFSVWEIPYNQEKNALLKIMNKQGVTVYQKELDMNAYYEWNGRTQENTILPFGLYVYLIEYEDGQIEQGYITLVR